MPVPPAASPSSRPLPEEVIQAVVRRQRHWRRNRQLTLLLLFLWMAVSFVAVFEARALDQAFFGWPFSFWLAAQGAPLIYLALVAAYAVYMNRLDHRHGLDEDED